MFAIGIQGNNQTQCATRWQVTLYLLRGKRQETANALVSVPPISTSSLSALIYSMLSALRVINIWTAITLLSPPSGLSAECLQTATFLKVLGIDSKVFRQRGWSVSSPGGITWHYPAPPARGSNPESLVLPLAQLGSEEAQPQPPHL